MKVNEKISDQFGFFRLSILEHLTIANNIEFGKSYVKMLVILKENILNNKIENPFEDISNIEYQNQMKKQIDNHITHLNKLIQDSINHNK